MDVLLLTHRACLAHDPGEDHPECPDRLRAVLKALDREEFAYLIRDEAPRVTLEQLCRVHPRDYVEAILAARPEPGETLALDDDESMQNRGGWFSLPCRLQQLRYEFDRPHQLWHRSRHSASPRSTRAEDQPPRFCMLPRRFAEALQQVRPIGQSTDDHVGDQHLGIAVGQTQQADSSRVGNFEPYDSPAAPTGAGTSRLPRACRGLERSPAIMSQSDQEQIAPPGTEAEMTPEADHGETSYRGCDRLTGRVAVITGGDSGVGRAVAIAYAREGADVVISYLNEQEDEDARETARQVEEAGRRCLLISGDLAEAAHCRDVIERTVREFGRIDILVNNAAFQRTYATIEDIPDEEWDYTFRTNITAMFRLAKAAVPHMRPGSSIINTTSIQSDKPSSMLLAYASTKGAVSNFTAGLAQMLGSKGIRVNAVAPGPIWTPLIPSTMPEEKVKSFGKDTPLGRAGQPKELAGIYVLLASEEGSYMNGGIYSVTGGIPLL